MFKTLYTATVFLLTLAFSVTGFAAKADPEIAKVIVSRLSESRPDLKYGDVDTTPISGLYRVRVNTTQFLFASETGEYIMSGEMFQARPGMFVPVADLEAAGKRRELMAAVDTDDMIVFPAVDETKAILYVFTDVDCGYCRKLHNESLPGLTLAGVEVRYLAFPRAGIGSGSYKKISSAWCADDRQTALTALKMGQAIEQRDCENNPVAAQYRLGQQAGVTGTPALIMEDGSLIPGYRPAEELLKMIGVK